VVPDKNEVLRDVILSNQGRFEVKLVPEKNEVLRDGILSNQDRVEDSRLIL
jgi:hypothetical protein